MKEKDYLLQAWERQEKGAEDKGFIQKVLGSRRS